MCTFQAAWHVNFHYPHKRRTLQPSLMSVFCRCSLPDHLPIGAEKFSVTGTDVFGGGAEFAEAASGANTLSCLLNLNFFRYAISRNSCVGAMYTREIKTHNV